MPAHERPPKTQERSLQSANLEDRGQKVITIHADIEPITVTLLTMRKAQTRKQD